MENLYFYVISLQWIAIVALAVWVRILVNKGRRELVYAKEELNLTIKSLESELTKLKKDVLKHSYKHEKDERNNVNYIS